MSEYLVKGFTMDDERLKNPDGRLKADLAIRKSQQEEARLLQQNGSSNYLEVLTAQENLLSAQMSRLQNQYNKVAAMIALYQATM